MINFNDLNRDIRLVGFGEETQKVMSLLNLSDTQVDELLNPKEVIIEHESITAIEHFLRKADKLMICGDYDADGVSSTAIAMLIAKEIGLDKPGYFIPNRMDDGYGINKDIVKLVFDKGYTDLLVVDNGVKATESLQYALDLGLNVAVVDHHIIESFAVDCILVHPDFLGAYASEMSAGGLMCVIAEAMGVLTPKILAYGALATIADVMGLWGKNREIVRRGLEVMNTTRVSALDYLVGSKVSFDYTAQDVAFKIVPKINSVGRMADIVNMNTMVEYLISENDDVLKSYALNVIEVDSFRKAKSKENLDLAKRMVRDDEVLVIAHPDFHEGIMGIVANQLVQAHNKPAILLKRDSSGYIGSARSNSISLQALFSKLDPKYFLAFGGHDFAYGMTIDNQYFDSFYEDVQKLSKTLDTVKEVKKAIMIDTVLSKEFFEDIKRLEPFGSGFTLPEFMINLPDEYRVINLNGYGYKLVFDDFWLKDAVYFNQNIMRDLVGASTWAVGSFSLHPRFGLSFNISQIGV